VRRRDDETDRPATPGREEERDEMAQTIVFTCSDCSEEFSEPIQKFLDEPGAFVMAPALCVECGHGLDEYIAENADD
jgi:hypothetical protein